ncbi:MAG: hypothetical protein WDO18_12350 [Acidobacteriota bacterium]
MLKWSKTQRTWSITVVCGVGAAIAMRAAGDEVEVAHTQLRDVQWNAIGGDELILTARGRGIRNRIESEPRLQRRSDDRAIHQNLEARGNGAETHALAALKMGWKIDPLVKVSWNATGRD